jgi:hypothetical protein
MRKIAQWLYVEFIFPVVIRWRMYKERTALKRASEMAEHLSERSNNMKHIVIPDYNNKLIPLWRTKFLLMKRRGMFDKKCTWDDMLKSSLYTTK